MALKARAKRGQLLLLPFHTRFAEAAPRRCLLPLKSTAATAKMSAAARAGRATDGAGRRAASPSRRRRPALAGVGEGGV